MLAARAGVPALRYAGPYPTPALWRALATRRSAPRRREAEFTAELIPRAARLAREPIAIDFAPAPCECLAIAGDAATSSSATASSAPCSTGSPTSPRGRRRASSSTTHAEVWFGDAPYARVATFDPDGDLLDGPHPLPPCTSGVLGQEFPPALAYALAELVAEAVPAPLADDARAWIAARPIRWADPARAPPPPAPTSSACTRRCGTGSAHSASARLALALAEALAPVATSAVIDSVLARAHAGR